MQYFLSDRYDCLRTPFLNGKCVCAAIIHFPTVDRSRNLHISIDHTIHHKDGLL